MKKLCINELIKIKFDKKDEKFVVSKKPRLLQVRSCSHNKAIFFLVLFIIYFASIVYSVGKFKDEEGISKSNTCCA